MKSGAIIILVALLVAVIGVAGYLSVSTSNAGTSSSPGVSYQGSTTTPTPSWYPGKVVSLVIDSPEVQSYVVSAYSYYIQTPPAPDDSNLAAVKVTVTGNQSVSGNWTTGYTISYAGNESLYGLVRFSQPVNYTYTHYTLVNVTLTKYPVENQSIMFDAQQQRVIQVALTNSSVKALMKGNLFYVNSVAITPGFNGTYAGDYIVSLQQVNGAEGIGVFVNAGATTVVASNEASEAQSMCFQTGTNYGVPVSDQPEVCFTSPWSTAH
jgi:hypothetical protein